LQEEITKVVTTLGVNDVHIRARQISDYEKTELYKKLQLGGEAHQGAETQADTSHLDEMQKVTQNQMKAAGFPKLLEPASAVTFIAVASGKGGVGKSTVTVNLAVALARKGKKVGLIDADIYGFSVPDMMGIEERPEMDDNLINPIESHGVKVISMGFFVEENAPVIWRGPMLGKMLRNFFNEVSWGDLDYVLLDLPPGTGDVALDVHQMIPQSKEILVTTPHATAAFVAARAGAMAKHTNHEILGVVENMAYYVTESGNKDYIFGRGGGAKLAEEMQTELLAQIPLGAPDNSPSEEHYAPSIYKAESDTGQIYLNMAERIIRKTSIIAKIEE
ncbi:MAG TPA: Mrp/NBP35 family ATP-binding protein, partial [Bacilli bacterium]